MFIKIFYILQLMNLQTFLIVQPNSSTILHQFLAKTKSPTLEADTKIVTTKAKSLRMKPSQREILKSESGSWFLTKDQNNLVYSVCAGDGYPQRLAYGLCSKVQDLLKQKNNTSNVQKSIRVQKSQINALCNKFQDPKADKVRQALSEVDSLKGELHKGIGKILENQGNLQQLGEKTSLMKDYAKQFQKQADVVQKKAFCHKYKTFFMIGIIIGSVLVLSGIVAFLSSR